MVDLMMRLRTQWMIGSLKTQQLLPRLRNQKPPQRNVVQRNLKIPPNPVSQQQTRHLGLLRVMRLLVEQVSPPSQKKILNP